MEAEKLRGVLILQARMGSQRLPGKSALSLGGMPLIEAIMQRLDRLTCEKWLATSNSVEDELLVDIGHRRGWQVYRGSKENVVSRFEAILRDGNYDYCIRVTGDNPLVCPNGLQLMTEAFAATFKKIDYISDFELGQYPTGAFAEIFSAAVFLESLGTIPITDHWHFSHVTSWMRLISRTSSLKLPREFKHRPKWRWTVDYPEDFQFINQLVNVMGSSWLDWSYPEIVKVLDKYPQLTEINQGLVQKQIELG